MAVNPWHPWHNVSIGEKAPEVVTAIIEIPAQSKQKYEIDKDTGMLLYDRVMSSSVLYPVNYGFIPKTYCDDGDALDIMVLGQLPAQPLCLMNARVIGGLKMIDGGEEDDKILAVHVDDPQFKHITSIDQANPHTIKEIEQFFRSYKALEKKVVELGGWVKADEAIEIVKKSIALYENSKAELLK